MAKRTRGTTSRPGQRARLERSAAARRPAPEPVVAPRPSTLTDAEERRAAELEAEIVAAERAAAPAPARRERQRESSEARVRPGTLATRAAAEYGYVSRDVRRIVLIGGSMIILLLVLWVVQQVTGFGPL